MRGTRQRWLRPAGTLLLAVLLLAPLVASAHEHAGHHSALPCAICVAAHHTPAVAPMPIAAQPLAALVIGILPVPATRASAPARRAACGRAPPSLPLRHHT